MMGIRLLLLLLLLHMATLTQQSKQLWQHNFVANASIDIVFVLDRSSYVNKDFVRVTQNVLLNLASNLNYDKTRIAVIRYGTRAEVIFSDLKRRRPTRWCELRKSVDKPAEGYSALTDALHLTEDLLLDSTSSQKAVILMTGSQWDVGKSPFHQAFRLKSLLWTRDGGSERIALHVLGFGKAPEVALKTLVAPHGDRLVWFDNVEDLEVLAETLKPEPPACAEEIVFPVADVGSEDSVEAQIRPSLAAITVCFWAKPGQGGDHGTVFSYTEGGRGGRRRDENIFTLTDVGNLELRVHAGSVRTKVTLTPFHWTHVCVRWRNGTWSLHVNGSLSKNGVGIGVATNLDANGTFELGQLARLPSGRRDTSASFHGSLSQVNVYSTLLSPTLIGKLARKDTPCNYLPGDVIGWPDLLSGLRGTLITKAKGTIGAAFDWCPEKPVRVENCAISERCWSTNESVVCECDQNEQLCQTTYDRCRDQSHCHGNGLCVVDEDEEPNCLCHFGFSGDDCKTSVCETCQHGATCSDDDTTTCNCTGHYVGRECAVMYKPDCAYEPCSVGNGNCSLTDDAEGYHCHCSNKDLGRNCQAKGECEASPCPEGAICINSVNDSYICHWNGTGTAVPITTSTGTISPGKVVSTTIDVELRLHMEWNESLNNNDTFKSTFIKQVEGLFASTYTGTIDVRINRIRSGSVIVKFNITFSGPGTPTNTMTADVVKAAFRQELRKGSFGPFNATERDLLDVTTSSAIPPDDQMDETRLGIILGGTLAVVCLIIVCISGTVYYRLRSQNEFEQMSCHQRSKPTMGYDLTELSSPIARSTPKPISPSPVSSFFHRWSTRGQHRSDTLQTLMNNAESKETLQRDVITIEIHDNLGFIPDPDTLSHQSIELSSRREHTSLVTKPPPSGDNDELSLASSDTLKPDDTAVLDDSDFDSSIDSGEFDYNEELARSLKELDRVCSDEKLNVDDEDLQPPSGAFSLRHEYLQPPSGAFSLRREEIVTNIDDVELSDEADKPSPKSPTSNADYPKFTFLSHVIPNFEVIPTLELPVEPIIPPPIRSRTYSEQQRCILACFERQNFEYF